MTRDDITARVRVNLNDAGVTFYSANDLNDSIQDGYDEVSAIARQIEKSTTVALVSELTYYNLRNSISDLIYPFAIFNQNTNLWLEHVPLRLLQALRVDWECSNGEPIYYTVMDFKYTAIFPKQTTGSGNLEVFYKAQANTLFAATTPILPAQHEVVLEQYVTMDLLEQQEEIEKAQIWMQEYEQELLKVEDYVNRRIFTDRIIQLRENILIPQKVVL
jgi:hypothetical protein